MKESSPFIINLAKEIEANKEVIADNALYSQNKDSAPLRKYSSRVKDLFSELVQLISTHLSTGEQHVSSESLQ
ncbi:hypothetical protein ACE1TI_11335 [Alteribacillus sp. JSM 102045]|uniref:hypothetical protein n=1 Tax=Alteribacillus sp. JSM 102045 TaxID=1562101 RepID=UPI0035C22EF3